MNIFSLFCFMIISVFRLIHIEFSWKWIEFLSHSFSHSLLHFGYEYRCEHIKKYDKIPKTIFCQNNNQANTYYSDFIPSEYIFKGIFDLYYQWIGYFIDFLQIQNVNKQRKQNNTCLIFNRSFTEYADDSLYLVLFINLVMECILLLYSQKKDDTSRILTIPNLMSFTRLISCPLLYSFITGPHLAYALPCIFLFSLITFFTSVLFC